MVKTVLVLPDGREISSGITSGNAVKSASLTQSVNDGLELTFGSVCADLLEVSLITPGGGLTVAAGDEITVYHAWEDGSRTKVGLFTTEKPEKSSANAMKLVGYNRISRLDKDLTKWLKELTGWPYSLFDFAKMVCVQCGVTLANTEIPNGTYPVQKFSAEGITGRKLMSWVCQAAGRFCVANPDGKLEMKWYTPAAKAINLNGGVYYFQNGLKFEDYRTQRIDKVQIQKSEEDVGTIFPPDAQGENAYRITGNYLLAAENPESLKPVAESIYNQLKTVSYTPASVSIPVTPEIQAGNTVTITDINGKTITAYIMERKQTGQKVTLKCTGSPNRNSVTAVNTQSYKALNGKVLNLRTDVNGLKVENADMKGNLASLELNLDGIQTTVKNQSTSIKNIQTDQTQIQRTTAGLSDSVENIRNTQTQMQEAAAGLEERVQTIKTTQTQMQQTAEGLSVSVQNIISNGVSRVETETGYTFDAGGMRITKSGEEIENLIDNTGMYVKRSNEPVLTANAEGVKAEDLHATTYCIFGNNSRFENYGANRTGCFWIGGEDDGT